MADFEPITTQEQFDSMIKARLERERNTVSKQYADYDDLKTANANLQKSVEELNAGNSELTKQIETLTNQVNGFKTEELKTKIAIEVGLPLEMRSRLTGTTEEEIKADAAALAKYVQKPSVPLRSNEPNVMNGDAALLEMLHKMKN